MSSGSTKRKVVLYIASSVTSTSRQMPIKVAQKLFHWKWVILTPLQKLRNNVGNLGKIIVATGFEKSPKEQ